VSGHLKRVTIPRNWPIARKTNKWVARPNPGPHSGDRSLPLVVVIRDMLKLADNSREAKRVLYEGNILVDGIVRKDYRFPVGIFDVISIPVLGKHYRMLVDSRGHFYTSLLEPGHVRKLARVENKTCLKGNKIQLNLSDGTNILGNGNYSTHDSLVLSIPDKNVEDWIPFEVGNLVMVVGGRHSGQIGTLKEIKVVRSSSPNRAIISGETEFETIVDYVFMIGRNDPVIKLGAIK